MLSRIAVVPTRVPPGAIIVTLLCLAIAAGAPIVAERFPDYLSGYLIQIPAPLIVYAYCQRFDLLTVYRTWPERLLLVLAFAVPLQNTFIVKAYRKALLDQHIILELLRPDILLLIGLSVWLLRQRRAVELPQMLQWSFWLGLAGWAVSTTFADYPLLSIGHGFFEFLAFWLALYAFLAVAPDRRFIIHAAALFCIGVGLVALAQTAAILLGVDHLPLFASEFLAVKMDLPLMVAAGGNGYGNTDQLVTALLLVIAFLAGALYLGFRPLIVAAILILLFASMLTYSRAGTVTLVIGLLSLWFVRAVVFRRASLTVLAIVALIGLSHTDPEAVGYLTGGVQAFFAGPEEPAGEVRAEPAGEVRAAKGQELDETTGDYSGVSRVMAWRTGLRIASEHPLAGIGYGHYRLADPVYTAPHNMVLLRMAEGGILTAVSFLLLGFYAPMRLLGMLRNRERDMFAVASLVAVSTFFLKGAIFGASFSIMGLIVWGFGTALLLNGSLKR